MSRLRLVLAIAVFGSIWGLLESVLGGVLPGSILTGLVAIGLMALSRRWWHQPGTQVSMAVVASLLRYVVPLGECQICSTIAIVAEGLIFEAVVRKISWTPHRPILQTAGGGIVAGYLCYVGGYAAAQFITPLAVGRYPQAGELLTLLPLALSRATVAGLLGGALVPLVVAFGAFRPFVLSKRVYYPVTSSAAAVCWLVALLLR